MAGAACKTPVQGHSSEWVKNGDLRKYQHDEYRKLLHKYSKPSLIQSNEGGGGMN
jgi:hypothetical protein